jgi:ABC-type phosphate transport system substrate-binding protein
VTWTELARQIGAGTPVGTACEVTPIAMVRSDASGTSFAFKQYLSQIKSSVWAGFVTNEPTWPTATQAKIIHINGNKEVIENHGSKQEGLAVVETANSIGYVNVSNAASDGIKAWNKNGQNKVYWGQVQNNGLGTSSVEAAEPVKTVSGKIVGNCPPTYTFQTKQVQTKTEGKPPVWAGIELANINSASGVYPLCTFTYDVAWEKYKTKALEEAKAYGGLGEQVGNTVKEYLKFLLSEKEGQKDIETGTPEYYAPLPKNVREIAEKAVSFIEV